MPTMDELLNAPSPFAPKARTTPAPLPDNPTPASRSMEDLLKAPSPFARPATGGPTAPPATIQTAPAAIDRAAKDAGVVADETKAQESPDEGFWPLVGRSLVQGVVESGEETVAGARAATTGTVAGQAAALPTPDASDEMTKLQQQGIVEGYTNPRWWGVQVAHGIGSSAPMAAGGLVGMGVGAAAGGPVGAVAGSALGVGGAAALQQLVPSYKAARLRGLDHDDALNEALISTGLAGAFGTAMGIVGATPLTGTTAQVMANGTIKSVLKRPLTEMLVKMGVAEPSLMVAQQQAVHAAGPGGWITPDEALTSFIVGASMGGVMHAGSVAVGRIGEGVNALGGSPGLSFDALEAAHKALMGEIDKGPRGGIKFWPVDDGLSYKVVGDAIEKHPASSLEPHEWHSVLKGAHPLFDNIELPHWLADNDGKITKENLLSYVEGKGVEEEFTYAAGTTAASPTPMYMLSLKKRTPTDIPFSRTMISFMPDRDNAVTLVVHGIIHDSTLLGDLKSNPWDIIGLKLLEKAASWNADRFAWDDGKGQIGTRFYIPKDAGDFDSAMMRLKKQLVMDEGTTKIPSISGLGGPGAESKYLKVSPLVAANVRGGVSLFSLPPGTTVSDNPFNAGKQAITDFLDRAQAKGKRRTHNEWVQTPEGGSGLYLRTRQDGFVDVASLDFHKRGTGAFAAYLDHLEQEVARRGLNGVRVENIMNQRLIPFLEKRGYVKEPDPFGMMRDIPSMRKERANIEVPRPIFGGPTPGGPRTFPTAGSSLYTPDQLRNGAKRAVGLIEQLRRAMGMKVPINIELHDGPIPGGSGALGDMLRLPTGYRIRLSLSQFERGGVEAIFETLSHEFGHVVMYHFFDRSPIDVKNAIVDAFERWKSEAPAGQTMNQLHRRRDPAVGQYYGEHWYHNDFPLLSLTPERIRYWNGFEEWFAEQTARWATTAEKPLGIVDRTFYSLGRRILSVVQKFKDYLKGESPQVVPGLTEDKATRAVPEMEKYLDSLLKDAAPFAADIYAAAQLRSLRQNAAALAAAGTPSVGAVPIGLSTASGRGLISRIFGRGSGLGAAMAATADRFNRFYNYAINLPQLAKLNPHIVGLQRYRELVSMLNLEKVQMLNEAETTLHGWRALHTTQADAVARLIDDYMNMVYRSPAEVKAKVTRKPNPIEFEEMARRNGVDDRGLAVFQNVVKDFDRMLDRYRVLLEQGAHEIKDANGNYDPVKAADALAAIGEQIDRMRNAPYFPAMRFGKYTLTVRDSAGKVVHFETFGSQRLQRAALDGAQRHFPADHAFRIGEMAQDVAPLVGMPPGLLDKIADRLSLSPTQKEALEELRFEYMPAQSFAHRFRPRRDVAGYSTDFLRAYANYMFHGANYFTRAKYVDALREAHRAIRDVSATLPIAVKRDQIANYVANHLADLLDPRPDFATLRSVAFHWVLGFSPAAATINLSQTIFGTYPYLASKFGSDVKAIAAMANASRKWSSFYTKMKLVDTTDPELKGIREAVRQGLISETQANVLAATADGRALSQGFGGNRAEKAWNTFSRASQFLFEMTEQTNRRVAFRAAWDMAMADPGHAHVKAMVHENKILFESLRLKGFTEQEAGAFVTAKDAVESTQYVYAPWARPRIFRGKLGSLFVFHSFTQNTLFYLWNNPGAMVRSLILLAGAGGLMGLPGMEDANGIIRGLAYRLFGKDFDLDDLVRGFVRGVLHGGEEVERPGDLTTKEGVIRPDILLHGLSRVGYGIPAIADQLGSLAGLEHVPVPVVDRHQNVGMGGISPVPPAMLLAPEITGAGAGRNNVNSSLEQASQRASGAIFGWGYSLYHALMAQPTIGSGGSMVDWKRWENTMPTALRNASQALRFYSEGRARNSKGASVVRFDPNQPEDAMELLAKAMGYQPARLSVEWDRATAEKEAQAFWDIRREYLLRSAWNAKLTKDPDVYQSVISSIRNFNRQLPDEAKGKAITADSIRQNFESRAKETARSEQGLPASNKAVPLSRSVQQLHPEAPASAGRNRYPPQGGALGK